MHLYSFNKNILNNKATNIDKTKFNIVKLVQKFSVKNLKFKIQILMLD